MNQKKRILILLAEKERVSNAELNREICFRYSPRIEELRKAGFDIVGERDKGGLWWYRLVTPKNQIDFDTLTLIPQATTQGSLF